jgi:hypothetical protein
VNPGQPIISGDRGNNAIRFLFAAFFLSYIVLVAFTGLIDRYILPAAPALTVLLVMAAAGEDRTKPWLPLPFRAFSIILLTVLSCLSAATTHDYFVVNRARWQALNHATEVLKVTPESIEGGWEFNGWVAYANETHKPVTGGALTMKHGEKYAVTLSPASGYKTAGEWTFDRWLPPAKGKIYLLQQIQKSSD